MNQTHLIMMKKDYSVAQPNPDHFFNFTTGNFFNFKIFLILESLY